jgi:hypothetical protein
MQTLNDLYRNLAKKYHPDTVSSAEDKALFEELMVAINLAREQGDLDTLQTIESLGPVYLAVRNYERVRVVEKESYAEGHQPAPQARRRKPAKALGVGLGSFLEALHPYALWRLLESWDDHGAVKKLTTVAASCGWIFLFHSSWGLLGGISSLLAEQGSGHESVPGLIIVLLRGVLILASLPCVLPAAFLALIIGTCVGGAWLCSALASAILGYFHPLLALVPPWTAGVFLLFAGWGALEKR